MLVSQYEHTFAIRLNNLEIEILTGERRYKGDFYVRITGGFKRGLAIKTISASEYLQKNIEPGFRRESSDGIYKPYIQNNNVNSRRISLQYNKFELEGLSISRGVEIEPVPSNGVLFFNEGQLSTLWHKTTKSSVVPAPPAATTDKPAPRIIHIAPSNAQLLEDAKKQQIQSKVIEPSAKSNTSKSDAQLMLDDLAFEMGLRSNKAFGKSENTDNSKPAANEPVADMPASLSEPLVLDVPHTPSTPHVVAISETVPAPIEQANNTTPRRKLVASTDDSKGMIEFRNNAQSLNDVLAQVEGLFIRQASNGTLVLELEVEIYEEF
jgi:hypothetical protein